MHDDFAIEPQPGIPAPLPKGENILWQGGPDRKAFAIRILHMRKIAFYFGILCLWKGIAGFYDGKAFGDIVTSMGITALMGIAVMLIAWWYAGKVAKATIYTLTNKRLIMRKGVALPVTFQFPFTQIIGASRQVNNDGTATLCLDIAEHTKIAWPVLWPHVRPWHLAKPQPALRHIADYETAERLLIAGLSAAHSTKRAQQTEEAKHINAPIITGLEPIAS